MLPRSSRMQLLPLSGETRSARADALRSLAWCTNIETMKRVLPSGLRQALDTAVARATQLDAVVLAHHHHLALCDARHALAGKLAHVSCTVESCHIGQIRHTANCFWKRVFDGPLRVLHASTGALGHGQVLCATELQVLMYNKVQ